MNARILEVFQLTKGGVPRSAAALAAGVLATGLFGFAQQSVQQALVRPDLLPLRVRSLFKSYGGTHLTTAGMERLQIVGTLQRNDVSPARTSAAVITIELPSQIRLDEQLAGVVHSAAGDANGSGANDGPISNADGDLLQTMLLNWSGTFFSQVGGGASSRLLGERFKLIPAPQGGQQQYHTLVQVVQQVKVAGKNQPLSKLYGFNAATGLLEVVVEDSLEGNTRHRHETRLTGSQSIAGTCCQPASPTTWTASRHSR